jgi:hypothetical protein
MNAAFFLLVFIFWKGGREIHSNFGRKEKGRNYRNIFNLNLNEQEVKIKSNHEK